MAVDDRDIETIADLFTADGVFAPQRTLLWKAEIKLSPSTGRLGSMGQPITFHTVTKSYFLMSQMRPESY